MTNSRCIWVAEWVLESRTADVRWINEMSHRSKYWCMIDWLIGCSFDWSISWLAVWSIARLIDWSNDRSYLTSRSINQGDWWNRWCHINQPYRGDWYQSNWHPEGKNYGWLVDWTESNQLIDGWVNWPVHRRLMGSSTVLQQKTIICWSVQRLLDWTIDPVDWLMEWPIFIIIQLMIHNWCSHQLIIRQIDVQLTGFMEELSQLICWLMIWMNGSIEWQMISWLNAKAMKGQHWLIGWSVGSVDGLIDWLDTMIAPARQIDQLISKWLIDSTWTITSVNYIVGQEGHRQFDLQDFDSPSYD